jgi:hypothetical protein
MHSSPDGISLQLALQVDLELLHDLLFSLLSFVDLLGVECISEALCAMLDGLESGHVYELAHLLVTGVLDDGQRAAGSLMLTVKATGGVGIATLTSF